MPPTGKSIREDLARAKAAYAKNEELRTLQLVATGLRNFVAVKLPATERTQAEGLLREGQHKAALEYIKRGMEEAPENPRIYDFLLAACAKLEDWGLAERMLLEVRSRAGEQPLLEQAMAMACARLGRWQDAHDAAQRALDADPGLTEARKILSLAAKKLSPSPAG